MSKAIANLLDKPEHLVIDMIKKLEELNGSPSEDVRLLAANMQKLRGKLDQLGLDPSDTTSEELYQSLRAKFDKDSGQLDRALGVSFATGLAVRANKASELVANLAELPEKWFLKPSSAKALMRQTPPKRVMKKLNYHSVDSLLKRENIKNVFLAATQLESESWRTALAKRIAKLSSASFEMHALCISVLPENYQDIAPKNGDYIISDENAGVVSLCAANLPDSANVLEMSVALVSQLEKLSGANLSPEFYELNPALKWWSDNSHLIASYNSKPVSLSIKDIAHDSLYGLNYEQRSNQHGGRALFTALLERYENQSAKLADSIKAIGYELNTPADTAGRQPFGAQLAAEYAGAE